jgi:protein TonB
MKRLTLSFALILLTGITYAGNTLNIDTGKSIPVFTAVEQPPQYPGGATGLGKDIVKKLAYPDVARLIGIKGRIVLTFVVDRDGKMVEITPVNCIGAGCESEAVKALQSLKTWLPGVQKGKPVRVQYSIPIGFNIDKDKIKMKELRSSAYGFLFNIKDTIYTLDEAETILGKSFKANQVVIAEPYFNQNNDEKYLMPDKKEVYLIKIKG